MIHNAIRQAGFYIINGRSVVTHIIAKCFVCRKSRGHTHDQKMADLPSERVTPAPSFTYAGQVWMHLAVSIKEGRKELKRRGLIFTCLASRAIQLETFNAMTTDFFLNAAWAFYQLQRETCKMQYRERSISPHWINTNSDKQKQTTGRTDQAM